MPLGWRTKYRGKLTDPEKQLGTLNPQAAQLIGQARKAKTRNAPVPNASSSTKKRPIVEEIAPPKDTTLQKAKKQPQQIETGISSPSSRKAPLDFSDRKNFAIQYEFLAETDRLSTIINNKNAEIEEKSDRIKELSKRVAELETRAKHQSTKLAWSRWLLVSLAALILWLWRHASQT